MELQSEPSNLKIFISWIIIVMISGITGWVANSEPPDLWYKTDNVSYQSHPHQYEWLKVGPLSLKHYESHSVGLFMDVIEVKKLLSFLTSIKHRRTFLQIC